MRRKKWICIHCWWSSRIRCIPNPFGTPYLDDLCQSQQNKKNTWKNTQRSRRPKRITGNFDKLKSKKLNGHFRNLKIIFNIIFYRSIFTMVLQHLMPRALPHRIILLMLITTMMKKMAGKCQTFIMTRK